jgi:hypothetical protein
MSFAFSVQEDAYDTTNHMRTIRKVKKLYDVSAVATPAYDDTSISARDHFQAVAENERALASANLRKKLILQTML